MTATQSAVWIDNPQAYRDKMEQLLGDRDPFSVLSETPDALAVLTSRHPAKLLRTRPFPDKWTPNEIIGHLSDADWVYGFRMRMILCENEPKILGMDQDLWVAGQRLNDREPREVVEMFRALRGFNLLIWKQMSPTDFKRIGRHDERGPESLAQMLRMLAGHDLSHLGQITRYIDAVKQMT